MSASEVSNLSETENNCVVCFKNVDVFSVGVCDHPVCFECSTRMRVLCNQLECPICRQEMPKVVFTKEIEPFSVLKPKVERLNLQDRKYGLFFPSTSIQRRYYRLLEHECIICKRNGYNGPFRTFQQLKDHMRRSHELYYCDLCVANLKIFTFERSFYTRAELATHRRKGDPDNTSHRGHPLCEFCETRFMDNDELFRHLRRDHLFCHFCDLDGKHQYYSSYNDLRKHYLEEHYLCEEGDCKYEKFTSVFRSDIDLKAHYAAVHGKNLSKAANRQARTLEVEFTLAPRARPDMSGRGGRHYGNNRHMDRQSEEEGAVGYDLEPGGPGGGIDNEKLFNNPLAAENFPSLSGDTSLGSRATLSNVTITSKLNPLSEENFPSLSGVGVAPPRSSAVTITTSKFNPRNAQDFPSLSGSASARQPAVTITRTVRGQQGLQRNSSNFPALRESATIPSTGGSVRVSSAAPGSVRVSSASASSGSVRLSLNNMQDHPSNIKAPNVSIHVNHKPNGAITTRISQTSNGPTVSVRPKTSEAFPALSSSEPISQPQWVSQKPKKQQEPKVSKVAPAPVLPSSSLNDFPTLGKGKNDPKSKKSSSVTMPVSNSWVNLNNFNSDAKNSQNSNSSSNDLRQKLEKNKENKGGVKNIKATTAKSSKTIELTSTDTKNGQIMENKTTEGNEDKNKNKKKKGKNNNGIEELSNSMSRIGSISEELTLNKNEKNSVKPEESSKSNQMPNGITKKRSELKIGALEVTESNSSTTDANPSVSKPPPPPGFSVKPPPGFNNFILPNNSLSNDLTFTNSSGQSYSIIPSSQFYPPPNFKSRNQFLIEKFKTVLRDSDSIQQFKVYSDMFRVGEIAPEKYYEHCRFFMGSDFGTIFPELLVLLPNVERQQQLYKVHQSSGKTKGLEMCATCKQIILTSDLRNHLSNHVLDNHFPVLSQGPSESNNVWNKK